MFAKSLEDTLVHLLGGSDFAPIDPKNMAQRFEALRSYGRLPAGRENRAARLTINQISDAVLSLAPLSPAWAGHAAVVLSNLQPVGGPADSFAGASNLQAAIATLLSDLDALEQFDNLHLLMSGPVGNVGGQAVLNWRRAGALQSQGYVSSLASSLIEPGSEGRFVPLPARSYAGRGLTLTKDFFRSLTRSIARSAALSTPPGDGSEYDADDARRERLKRLGVRRNARYLNIGVETQTHWPSAETVITFEGHQLILMPATRETSASLHIDLHGERLDSSRALTIMNRLLSIMVWEDDAFANLRDGWSGNPVPVAVPARNLAKVTSRFWLRPPAASDSDRLRRALGYYREGVNAEEAELVAFAVLSFFKVLEIRYGDRTPKVRGWVKRNFPEILGRRSDDPRIEKFNASRGDETAEDYIMRACRIAVAHASVKQPSDPDDMSELGRLTAAAHVLRLLARRMIGQLVEPDVNEDDAPAQGAAS